MEKKVSIPRLKLYSDDLTSIEDLKPGMCKFPIGDPYRPGFGFCGKPIVIKNGSYCSEHERVCHVHSNYK